MLLKERENKQHTDFKKGNFVSSKKSKEIKLIKGWANKVIPYISYIDNGKYKVYL